MGKTSFRGWDLVRAVAMSALFALAVHAVLAQIGGLETAARAILRATWWLLPVTIGLEALSLSAYGELVRLLLGGVGSSPPRAVVQRAIAVGNALGRSMPGGAPVASVMVARIIARNTGDVGVVTTAVGASGVISSACRCGPGSFAFRSSRSRVSRSGYRGPAVTFPSTHQSLIAVALEWDDSCRLCL